MTSDTGSGRVSDMLDIMADMECALVLTREYAPAVTVAEFVDTSAPFKRLADFLLQHQHDSAPNPHQVNHRTEGSPE